MLRGILHRPEGTRFSRILINLNYLVVNMPLSFGHDEDDAEIKVSEIVEQANAKYLNWGKANSTSYDCFSLLATNPQTEHIVTV
jgi:hypothetical protein